MGKVLTFYLLEKFVWHHTSLNFVHTKKNPFQGALAFFDNASSVLLSLLGTDTDYIRTRGRCVCEHFSWDSDPQPRHQGWWWTPPCRCSRGERRRGSLNSSAVVLDIQVLQSLSPLSCVFYQCGSSSRFQIWSCSHIGHTWKLSSQYHLWKPGWHQWRHRWQTQMLCKNVLMPEEFEGRHGYYILEKSLLFCILNLGKLVRWLVINEVHIC